MLRRWFLTTVFPAAIAGITFPAWSQQSRSANTLSPGELSQIPRRERFILGWRPPPGPPPPQTPALGDSILGGFERYLLSQWGDRITYNAPAWAPDAITPEAAAGQFGWDGRVLGLAVPGNQPGSTASAAILAVAHPEVVADMAFPRGRDNPAVALAMQGVSIFNMERRGTRWAISDGGYQSRRLSGLSPVRFSGPAVPTVGASGTGLLGVQGGCMTPWGTLLMAEGSPDAWMRRLRGEPAFSGAEAARKFGWMVELDPQDPNAVPVKRTALGRIMFADAAAARTRDGRAVVYMSQAGEGGHLFRFISRDPVRAGGAAANAGILDSGTLSVARVGDDAVLHWVALPANTSPFDVPAAAQRAGGYVFNEPSGLAVDPQGTQFYLACRGGTPRRVSREGLGAHGGYVLSFEPDGMDHGAERGRGTTVQQANVQSNGYAVENPDTVEVDMQGNLWVGTNHAGRGDSLPRNRALRADGLFMLVGGRAEAEAVYIAPRGAAMGGVAFSPDGGTAFTAVRHPGAEPDADYEDPTTRWPHFNEAKPPRSALISIYH